MESTRQNLLRVSDVVAEIEKQLGSLRRQAQKAERYKQYKAELRDIDLWSASQRWLGLVAEERVAAEAQRDGARGARGDARAAGVARGRDRDDAARAGGARPRRCPSCSRASTSSTTASSSARPRPSTRGARRAGSRSARSRPGTRSSGCRRRPTPMQAEIERIKAELALATEAASGSDESLRRARRGAARGQGAAAPSCSARVEAARAEVTTCKGEIVGFEGAERAASRRRDELHTRILRAGRGRGAQRRSGAASSSSAVGKHARELEGLKQLKLDLADQKQRTEARVGELKEMLAGGGKALEALTTELHKRRSRRHSLDELHAKYEGFARGTRAVMQHKETRWGIRDLFADAVDAPAELDVGGRGGAGRAHGRGPGREPGGGRRRHRAAQGEVGGARDASSRINRFAAARARGGRARARACAGASSTWSRFGEDYESVAETLFGDVVVVDDLLTALDRWRGGGSGAPTSPSTARWSTPTAWSPAARARRRGRAILAQKREIRELDGIIGELESQHNDAQFRHQQLKNELRPAADGARGACARTRTRARCRSSTLEKDLARDREELARLRGAARTSSATRSSSSRSSGRGARARPRRRRRALAAARDAADRARGRAVVARARARSRSTSELEAAQEAVTRAQGRGRRGAGEEGRRSTSSCSGSPPTATRSGRGACGSRRTSASARRARPSCAARSAPTEEELLQLAEERARARRGAGARAHGARRAARAAGARRGRAQGHPRRARRRTPRR